jgi:hypothetical protein
MNSEFPIVILESGKEMNEKTSFVKYGKNKKIKKSTLEYYDLRERFNKATTKSRWETKNVVPLLQAKLEISKNIENDLIEQNKQLMEELKQLESLFDVKQLRKLNPAMDKLYKELEEL